MGGSAFSFYFTERAPRDLHDIITGHDSSRDSCCAACSCIAACCSFPSPRNSAAFSAAHTPSDIDFTPEQFDPSLLMLEER
jgi:hypothetical protein